MKPNSTINLSDTGLEDSNNSHNPTKKVVQTLNVDGL